MWENPKVAIYPHQVSEIISSTKHSGEPEGENASGKSASFVCGSFVRLGLRIDPLAKRIDEIRFVTNGCGFAIAAAEALARKLHQTGLVDLHGARDVDEVICSNLGHLPQDRVHCSEMVIEALRAALANYRARVVEEFQGETALICTCFGIAEDTIVNLIEEHRISELLELSAFTNAGSGCGSCQMLIRDLIEAPRN